MSNQPAQIFRTGGPWEIFGNAATSRPVIRDGLSRIVLMAPGDPDSNDQRPGSPYRGDVAQANALLAIKAEAAASQCDRLGYNGETCLGKLPEILGVLAETLRTLDRISLGSSAGKKGHDLLASMKVNGGSCRPFVSVSDEEESSSIKP